jgi:NAD+ diphosphatase
MTRHLPLARAGVPRDAQRRAAPGLLAGLLADPATRVLAVHGSSILLEEPRPGPGPAAARHLSPGDLPALGVRRLDLGDAAGGPAAEAGDGIGLFLGQEGGAAHVGVALRARPEPPPGARWAGLRGIGAALGPRDAGLATAAAALAEWHGAETFCPRCGTATAVTQAGWARRCPADGLDVFPRTDPAVIMSVLDADERLLLAHSAHWPDNRYSLTAGFVEAGEALEAAVRREVAEEVGLEVGVVRYLGSQPWPFPRSLMCAFEARALTTDIAVDGQEIADARWFGRAELAGAVRSGEVGIAPRSAVARVVIEDWLGARIDAP